MVEHIPKTLVREEKATTTTTTTPPPQNDLSDTKELLLSCDICSNNSTSRGAAWKGLRLRQASETARSKS